jgi:hypothetical protein
MITVGTNKLGGTQLEKKAETRMQEGNRDEKTRRKWDLKGKDQGGEGWKMEER